MSRSTRKRNREEEPQTVGGKRLRPIPPEARIVISKLNENRSSKILDFFSFGANDNGQLGGGQSGSANLVQLEGLSDVNSLGFACGRDSSVVLESNIVPKNRNVYTWGGDISVVVRDTDEDSDTPNPVESLHEQALIQVAVGEAHAAALTATGDVITWGTYMDGKRRPIGFRPRMAVDEFGLPEIMEEIQDVKIIQIACTHNRTLALTETGDVWEWGNTKLDNRTLNRHQKDTLVPSAVLIPAKIIALYAEGNGGAVFAEDTDGKIWAWGRNQFYQCGIDEEVTGKTEEKRQEKRDKISSHSRPSKAKQINSILEAEGETVKKISSGRFHSVLLTDSGDVFTWGENSKGQLGIDGVDLEDVLSVPTRVALGDLRGSIADIASGPFHTLLLTEDGDVYGFGANKDHCLGNLKGDIITEPAKIKLSHKSLKGKIVGIACGSRHNIVAVAAPKK